VSSKLKRNSVVVHNVSSRCAEEGNLSSSRFQRSASVRQGLSPLKLAKLRRSSIFPKRKPRSSKQPCKRRFKGQPFEKFDKILLLKETVAVEEEELQQPLTQAGEQIWTVGLEFGLEEERTGGEHISFVKSRRELQQKLNLGELHKV